MGLRRLAAELKKARGMRSQKAAAAYWNVPYSTLCALEQAKVRNYQPQTLAHFDAMLGRSAWDLYEPPDEAGWDVPAASVASVEELRSRLDELETALRTLSAQQPVNRLEALAAELTDAELTDVVSFAHFVLARRRSAG
jgi:hypothetical protein